jgi:hypothetical protein
MFHRSSALKASCARLWRRRSIHPLLLPLAVAIDKTVVGKAVSFLPSLELPTDEQSREEHGFDFAFFYHLLKIIRRLPLPVSLLHTRVV